MMVGITVTAGFFYFLVTDPNRIFYIDFILGYIKISLNDMYLVQIGFISFLLFINYIMSIRNKTNADNDQVLDGDYDSLHITYWNFSKEELNRVYKSLEFFESNCRLKNSAAHVGPIIFDTSFLIGIEIIIGNIVFKNNNTEEIRELFRWIIAKKIDVRKILKDVNRGKIYFKYFPKIVNDNDQLSCLYGEMKSNTVNNLFKIN
jgi:hypothetical protein